MISLIRREGLKRPDFLQNAARILWNSRFPTLTNNSFSVKLMLINLLCNMRVNDFRKFNIFSAEGLASAAWVEILTAYPFEKWTGFY